MLLSVMNVFLVGVLSVVVRLGRVLVVLVVFWENDMLSVFG